MRPSRTILLRLGGAVFVLWAVATLTFFAIHLVPGDPAQAILGGPGSQASQEALDRVRADYGLDRPLFVQYLAMLGRLLVGDFGTSYSSKVPVGELIAGQLLGTLTLAVLALTLSWVLAIGLALWATAPGRAARSVSSAVELTAAALPHFWLATVLIAVFSTGLGWLPPVANGAPTGLVLPVITLAVPLAGFLAQLMREHMLAALEQPFTTSALARGETGAGIRLRHALRHAVLPAVHLSGWAIGYLISGAVVVETIFARPGLGRTLLRATEQRDVPVVVGVVLVVAVVYVVMTVVTDAVAGVADPRLRREGAAA